MADILTSLAVMNGRNLHARDGSILIVCTGNVCRSPYVERLLKARLAETNINVMSAGTAALTGSNMDPEIMQRLALTGADAGGFSATQLTESLINEADLILCVTRQHRSQVVQMTPRALRRTYALADFSDLATPLVGIDLPNQDENAPFLRAVSAAAEQARASVQPRTRAQTDIVDPFRQPKKFFEHMFAQVDGLLPPIVAALTGAPLEPILVGERPHVGEPWMPRWSSSPGTPGRKDTPDAR